LCHSKGAFFDRAREREDYSRTMLKRILGGFALVLVTSGIWAAETPVTPPLEFRSPAAEFSVDRWEIDFESGILWRAGHNGTDLNYILMPQILTLKTPVVMRRALARGELVMRSRFSLLHEPITKGPETHFTAVTASGILEWWNATRTFSWFFSSGGGVGLMDSKGYDVVGAQGQDFNFTWFLYPGVRYRWSGKASASLGVYYQHVSNRGLDKVNPGIDAVGPMLSLGWHF
jgi:lipid A 3-O-deacylase